MLRLITKLVPCGRWKNRTPDIGFGDRSFTTKLTARTYLQYQKTLKKSIQNELIRNKPRFAKRNAAYFQNIIS